MFIVQVYRQVLNQHICDRAPGQYTPHQHSTTLKLLTWILHRCVNLVWLSGCTCVFARVWPHLSEMERDCYIPLRHTGLLFVDGLKMVENVE